MEQATERGGRRTGPVTKQDEGQTEPTTERDSGGLIPAEAPEAAAAEFERHRAMLVALAYRMVGGVATAEDLVQEAYLRWQGTDAAVASARSFLVTTVTRLAIDHLRSARVRREEYVGPWLPEPLITGRDQAAPDPAELAESLSTAFLVLLERLAPLERAVFLLREVFGLEYTEVGRAVDRPPPTCRQIAKRARDRVVRSRPRFDVTDGEAERMAEAFMTACASGDVAAFLPLLSADVVTWSDSDGKVPAARRPILGADRCARFWAGLGRKGYDRARVQRVQVNGAPGFVLRTPDGTTRVLGFTFAGGRIAEVFVFSNPDRLGSPPPAS